MTSFHPLHLSAEHPQSHWASPPSHVVKTEFPGRKLRCDGLAITLLSSVQAALLPGRVLEADGIPGSRGSWEAQGTRAGLSHTAHEVIQQQTLNRPKGCTKHRLGCLIMSSCLLEAGFKAQNV